MTIEDKILKAFKCAILKLNKDEFSVYNNNERQWGVKFTLNKVSYKGIVYKYKNEQIENKGLQRLFSKYKTVEILQPHIEIRISNKIDYFRVEIEDNDFIKYYENFFKEVQEAIKLKLYKNQLKRTLEKEQFLNNISNC